MQSKKEIEIQKDNYGAINAIRGYRRQFLYSLYRILKDREKDLIFQPEGLFEDLDIKNSKGEYIETIQIKNTKGVLSFSDLFSKKDSFFKRAKNAINAGALEIKLICFGQISDELKDTSLNRVRNKLLKKGFTENQILKISSSYAFEIVTEDDIRSKIIGIIKNIELFTDPEVTIDLLLYWLYQTAEFQQTITSRDIVTQLNLICKYVSERIDLHTNFGRVIQPLELKRYSKENIELYKEGFYYGVSAKYEHILADVDIIRNDRLVEIQNAFKESTVVFIHGASGQGKSTLAYRYLKWNSSQFASYELKLTSDFAEVRRTINSLESLCKDLKFPVVLYIDVTSQYLYWEEIIKDLYDKTNIHFLVTIRQEDWNKLSIKQHFKFLDIELNFDKEEARELYSSISQYKTDLKFVNFEESWSHIGENSPLLEYVYLLTQGETLKSRLKEQLGRIQEKVESLGTKDIEVLRFVCLADSFNSRINYKQLINYIGISNPITYIDFFRNEYLIQLTDDKHYLIGLHPVRSKIITEILFNEDIFVDKFEYIDNSLNLVHEHDLHNFLLRAFEDKYEINRCIACLSKINFTTWSGYKNAIKGLIWKGAFDFVFHENLNVFNELYQTFKESWFLFLNIDFSGQNKNESILNIIKILQKDEEISNNIIEKYNTVNRKLTPQAHIYNYCIQWLSNKTQISASANNDIDWNSYGEFLFWLTQSNTKIDINIDVKSIKKFFEVTECISCMSTILLGLKLSNQSDADNILALEEIFLEKIRTRHNIIVLSISKKKVTTKYFFDLVDGNEDSREKATKNPFLEKTMEIQYYLRQAFPEKREFEINGYGYNIFSLDVPDDTHKCMPIENLPLKYLLGINGLIINQFNNSLRLDTWKAYVRKIVDKRRNHVQALNLFKQGLILYFKNNDRGINHLIDHEKEIKTKIAEENYSFPKCAIDKWGYQSENDDNEHLDNSINSKTKPNYVLSKFEKFNSSKQNYFNSSQNFINQSFTEIANTLKRTFDPQTEIEDDNLRNVSEINLFDSLYNLICFHEEFDHHFSKFIDPSETRGLTKIETSTLIELMSIWKIFLYSPNRINKSVERMANINFELTKNQFMHNILKEFIKLKKELGYIHNLKTQIPEKRLVIQINTSHEDYSNSLGVCFQFIFNVFSSIKHTSIKNLFTKLNFEKISIIPLFKGNPINKKYLELPIFRVDKINEIINSGKEINNLFEIFDFPTDITKDLLEKEGLIPWDEQIPEIYYYEQFMGLVMSIKYILIQVKELQLEFINLDNIGRKVFIDYQSKAIESFKKLIKTNESGIEALNSISSIKNETFSEIKTCISQSIHLINELRTNEDLITVDLELITNYSAILEDKYLIFSELMVLDFLKTSNE